LRIAARAVLYL